VSNKTSGQRAENKIKAALTILNDLGFPRQQQNERSALTLLSLLGLKPAGKWEDATDPLRGITPMMEFFEQHYGKKYAPNTRETVRRQTGSPADHVTQVSEAFAPIIGDVLKISGL
jgi:hypothetical protein